MTERGVEGAGVFSGLGVCDAGGEASQCRKASRGSNVHMTRHPLSVHTASPRKRHPTDSAIPSGDQSMHSTPPSGSRSA